MIIADMIDGVFYISKTTKNNIGEGDILLKKEGILTNITRGGWLITQQWSCLDNKVEFHKKYYLQRKKKLKHEIMLVEKILRINEGK